ncbi:3-hydroxyisobutyrate dehydrogenase [Alicycliphilus denitrificans]|uniref:NAD(P)-dependent oxidoreductase n=1 Tax=Alicycliphilus denitrificans TaxID=179636 RepID=A0A420KI99_9BURK|nr:NAD(P)-dependent oxidoreductase [Alicycliphilus denitrificans]MBN9573626.1 NAD(P)-dependent oxidoreductase [Alicycliphilus denitrificans]OJW90335.1 MAG: 2-hydroxy-3-oxopropionate reductase [Alicycliphilus sp. 69-12]RKJ99665.1 NAD(P)-dependent oxidoreductase [Alicycliphilus denitrificans]BCN38886.1 3-hydroxyisobutyrate dehydrogenase [Alicycliphilus denitrificans]
MNTPRIGLVGVGLMGHGIALNIARKGHALTVLEHPGNQPLDELRALGVASAATVQDLARQVQVLILCVTGSPQVEAVLLGEQGALAALQPGTVVIDCSTAIPASTESVARAVAAAGGRFLDAPMTRTPREAAEGRLNLLVGGDAQLLQECLPLLQCFAENVTHTGAVGSGHRMKLLHNYVSLGSVALIAEAAACALAAEVSPQVFVDVLAKGGGGGVALERLRPYLLQQDPSGLRFFMSNALKDMGYYTTMAQDGAAAHGIAQAVHDTFASAVAEGGPQRLVPELVAILGKNTA